jgi:hypothetical protein
MAYRIVRVLAAWWPAVWIVIIGGWKTTEFALSIAGDSQDWLLRAMAGLLFFGPFVAAEILPPRPGSSLQKLTKIVLFSYLMVALLLQALNSTRTMMNDGMEREQLAHLREGINRYEEGRLRALDRIYRGLLQENGCIPRSSRSQKKTIGCDTLWRQYEDILDAPRIYALDPPATDAFREMLRRKLDRLDDLSRKVPTDRRVFEYGTTFDFTPRDTTAMEILAWTAHHYGQERAQVLIAHFCRSIMLLVLTVIVGIWYHATADERKKLLEDPAPPSIR